MMKRKRLVATVVIIAVALIPTIEWLSGTHAVHAADNFNHSRIPLSTIYPSQDALMNVITTEKNATLAGQHSDGNFENAATPFTDGDWGCVALLAYWWNQNGQNDETVAAASRSGLDFALAHRNWTTDPSDTRYLLTTNSGESYTAYNLANSDAFGNYPTTAFTLINKAMILQFGQGLFSQSQLDEVKNQAYSNWRWLTRVSTFDPQSTSNQVMAAIVGGYMLGVAANDQSLKDEAMAYYDTGVAGTNNTSGYRNIDRISLQGFQIFQEKNGFEVHYGGMQMTYMAALYALTGSNTNTNIYNDLIQQASYIDNRLSEAGSMHGGTRHNEASGSITDIAAGLGYNFISAELGTDAGRVKFKGGTVPSNGSNSDLYGHRANPIILFHMFFRPWSTNQPTKNEEMSLRRANASIYFDGNHLPQEFAVNGTVFTDNIVNNGQQAQSFYYQNADGNWSSDVQIADNAYNATSNYSIRTVTGTADSGNFSIKSHYLTDGTSLYHITLIKANADVTLQNAQVMIGLPNISETKRIVTITDANNTSNSLDLSQDSGSLSSSKFTTGDVDIDGWPQLEANNTTSSYTWMTGSNYNKTIEDLVNLSPKVY